MSNKEWTWDKHKYKSKEWVKGKWNYIYDTASSITKKDTAKNTNNQLKSVSTNIKENISKKTEDTVKKIIGNKLNNDSEKPINSIYNKSVEVYDKDLKTNISFKYKYTDLVSDIIKDNPIPSSIALGLSILTGTTLGAAIGINITDTIIRINNNKQLLDSYEKAKKAKKDEQYYQYWLQVEEEEKALNERLQTALNEWNTFTDTEKALVKAKYPFLYMKCMAKFDDRETKAIEISDEEANRKATENNPGFWYDLFIDPEYRLHDQNCWICTLAYDLQRRGLDYYPDDELDDNYRLYVLYNKDIENLYKNPKVIDFKDGNRSGYTENEAKNIIDTMALW